MREEVVRMFFVRAAFWLAIVSVFVPRDFAGETMDLPFDLQSTRIDASEPVSEFCEDREAVCEAGEEAARLGGLLADMAIDRLEQAIDEGQDES
jgi:hypothetical protein